MRAPGSKLLLVVAGLAALALPGAAGAAGHTYKIPASTFENATLRGSNGFTIELVLGPGFEDVIASKRLGDGGFEHAMYWTPGPKHFNGGPINLRIGKYGRFRGKFVAKSTGYEPNQCTGGPVIVEKGFYVGTFAFHGPMGFTGAASHRVHGSITRAPAGTCREFKAPKKSQKGNSEPSVELHLKAAAKSEGVSFEATQESEPSEGAPSDPFTSFTASKYVRHGRLAIGSYVSYFFAKASTFTAPEPQAEVTVSPPAPFSGSATYAAEGKGKSSWTGNLSVDLPAFGRVHLTGKKLTATLEEEAVNGSGSFYVGGEATTSR